MDGMGRVEWLRLVTRRGGTRRGRQVLFLVIFEAYYQLCSLRGYRPRHFLRPAYGGVSGVPVGGRVLMTWPRLPLSIRLLNLIFPYGRVAHADFAPYTPEAVAVAVASGRGYAVIRVVAGEIKAAGI